jgi:ATP-dependent Clp protease protease subunit
MPVIPSVTVRDAKGERGYDVFSRLLNERIVYIGTPIDDAIANIAVASMLHLLADSKEKPINVYVNSPGGGVYAGLAIVDTMRMLQAQGVRVNTVCAGIAMSMGSVILAAGSKGYRSALPNSRIMIHQVSGGFQGQATDIEIQANEAIHLRHKLDAMLADYSGRSKEEISTLTERDHFMSPEETLELGLIDNIVTVA